MLALVALALAADPVAPAAPAPPPASPELAAGLAALKAKDAYGAIAALQKCAEAEPECRWQLGWAHWLVGDWARVVATWEKLDPAYESVATQLPIARGQLEIQRMAAAMRAAAPKTYVSKAPAGATVRLRAVGDMMIGTDFPEGYLPPDGGAGTFAGVAALLKDADFTFGNLEGPLCDAGETDKCKPDAAPGSCYAFRTPTSYARWYDEAGFDVVSTANNHSGDFGEECRLQTEKALDGAGILYSGRPGTIARWTTNGLKIAMIGFHTNPACHWLNDTETAKALVQGLAGENDLVIVSFHGGAEGSKALRVPVGPEKFYGEDRGDLRVFTHAVVDAGADLVLGHGPHVLRGMEVYNGRLIAYSLGNFATYGRFNLTGNQGIGAILDATLAADGKLVAASILGTRQEGEGVPVPDAANAAADLVRVLTAQDFPGTGAKIAQDGTLAVP
jgi:poly-gamma-glutamate capsule biosynthesis protein CapA/YwtB (metallophosphatase superfamily)